MGKPNSWQRTGVLPTGELSANAAHAVSLFLYRYAVLRRANFSNAFTAATKAIDRSRMAGSKGQVVSPGQVGRGFEQPGLAEGVPARAGGGWNEVIFQVPFQLEPFLRCFLLFIHVSSTERC